MALTTNLVSYYKLDGNSNDAVGSNNGTDTSITYDNAYGKINQGALSTASNKIVTGVTDLALTTFSISCWFYATADGDFQTLMNKEVSNTNTNRNWYLGQTPSAGALGFTGKSLLFLASVGGTADVVKVSSTDAITKNSWQHCVVTRSATETKMYINGVLKETQSYSGSVNTGGTYNNLLQYSGSTNMGWNGYADEFAIWSRVLSQTEVSELYNSGAGNQYPFTTTSIKSINGLAYASVKSWNGLAKASIKSINGLE